MQDTVSLKVKRLDDTSTDIPLPMYQSDLASGLDLCAAVRNDVVLAPGTRAMIPTGLAIAMPLGYEGQIRPRSGLAARHGVTVLNTPGTIDADYRGEVKVILINLGEDPFVVRRGDRIAQMVITQVTRADVVVVAELDPTVRGKGGFGHTGSR